MAAQTWTVTRALIEEHVIPGKPLGRHVNHDSRSLAYRWQATGQPLSSVLHARDIPILDQGNVGSCTGNAAVGCLGTDPLFSAIPPAVHLDEAQALHIYSAAEVIDGGAGLPGEDDGSSGLSAAKAARNAGLISGYTHILSLADLQDALQPGPVMIGINWYDSFDAIPASGLITISPGAQVRGGHEPMLRGVDLAAMEFYGDNSWSSSWGLQGSFRVGFGTVERLLAEQGDATALIPRNEPPPVPVPVPPAPPVPAYPDGPADLAHASPEMIEWAAGHHVGPNERAAKSFTTWRTARGL
jgi:hypothetical protein